MEVDGISAKTGKISTGARGGRDIVCLSIEAWSGAWWRSSGLSDPKRGRRGVDGKSKSNDDG